MDRAGGNGVGDADAADPPAARDEPLGGSGAAGEENRGFVASMAHELRTPLNAILGYAQLLQRDRRLLTDQQERVNIIHRSGEYMLGLVNDLVHLAQIDLGRDEVRRGVIDVAEMFADLSGMLAGQAREKGLRLSVEGVGTLPRRIVGDEGKIRQVLVNVVANAIKYTEAGSVTVHSSARPSTNGVSLVIDVLDTGRGITPALRARLFEPFSRGPQNSPLSQSSGLGLAISRELARAMGGEVTLESSAPSGSCFRFTVPVVVAGLQPTQGEGPVRRVIGLVGSANILVIDADPVGRGWVRRLLQDVGFDVREAGSIAAATAAVERRRPDLVLMEMRLPDGDGHDALRALRAVASDLAVVAFSTNASDSVRSSTLAAGANGWLTKPAHDMELLAELQRRLGVEYLYATPAQRTLAPPRARTSRPPPRRRLPPNVAAPLREAARRADYEELTRLLAAMPHEYAGLAEDLDRLASRFGYDEIETVLSETDGGDSTNPSS
jgi:CheY-like chemotaxis protein